MGLAALVRYVQYWGEESYCNLVLRKWQEAGGLELSAQNPSKGLAACCNAQEGQSSARRSYLHGFRVRHVGMAYFLKLS